MAVVIARNGKPVSAIRQDEIVEEIVVNLRPLKSHNSFGSVSERVRHAILVLLKVAPLWTKIGDRKKNRAHAKKLDAAVHEIEVLLSTAPTGLALFLSFPLGLESGDHPLEQALPKRSIGEFERAFVARANCFAAELKRLRKVCARAINPGLGNHPNYDHAKHMSAHFACELLNELSQNKVTGTKDGPFRVITSLFYEAVSGQRNADLKRACDGVLQP